MSQNQINLRLRMTRRLKENNGTVQCEKCGNYWIPKKRIGGRMPNNWWICPKCEYDGDDKKMEIKIYGIERKQ